MESVIPSISGLLLRPASLGDLPTLVEFNLRLAWETEDRVLDPAVLREGVAALLADPGKGRYWVAILNAEVVGQVMVTYEWTDWRNGVFWWLQSVYVRADCRGRGVFTALFHEVKRNAAETPQVRGLRLYVEEHNLRAREVYTRLGLQATGYQILGTEG